MALANLSTYYTWKNIKTINLKFQHQLGMILLIYLMVLTQFLIFKIILNLLPKNMKLYLKIHQFKFIQINLKIELFLK